MLPMEPSLVGTDGSDRPLESGSEVGNSIVILLGGPGYGVVFAEGVLLGYMWWLLYSLS